MFSNLTIGKRIAGGFCVVLAFLVAVVGLAYFGVGNIVQDADEVIVGNKLDGEMAQKEVDHLNWVNAVSALLTDDEVTKLDVQLDPHKCAFGQWLYGEERQAAEARIPSLKSLLAEIEQPHADLHASAGKIEKVYQKADVALGNFLREKKTDHLAWAHKVKDVLVDESLTEVQAEMDPKQCSLGKWMDSPEVAQLKQEYPAFAAELAKVVQPHDELHNSAREVDRLVKEGKREEAKQFYMTKTKPLAYECLDAIDHVLAWQDSQMEGLQQANAIFAQETKPALQTVQQLLNDVRKEVKSNVMTDEVMLSHARGTQRNVSLVGLVAVLLGTVLAVLIARSLVKVVMRLTLALDEGANQVNDAAGQVSSASQSLAEGASEQASSLEETSSALEELSAMTQTNAQNANEANQLASDAQGLANEGDRTTEQLNNAMTAINESSDKISKIIKVIEEIAFQTNLLALNAAVEAARAGEHGKGFAVVAEEVRNLAQRAAGAAGETTQLIEDSVTRAREGADVAGKVGESLSTIAKSVTKVSELIDGIARASGEQASGLNQINEAVSQMDKVTQANAGGAEEAASAAEQLSAQSQNVKAMVDELVSLAGGNVKSKAAAAVQAYHPSQPQRKPRPQPKKEAQPVAAGSQEHAAGGDHAYQNNDFSDF